MDQAQARKLSSEGFSLLEEKKFLEAEKKYKEAVKLADPGHLSSQDIHGEYSLVLRELGKSEAALEQLELSLSSSLSSGSSHSNAVSVALHFLAEYLIDVGSPAKAIDRLWPYLSESMDLKWLLHYSAARAYFNLKEKESYEMQVNEVVKTSPSSQFPDAESVKVHIGRYEQNSS